MPYYKDTQKQVYWFEPSDNPSFFEKLTKITNEEADKLRAPVDLPIDRILSSAKNELRTIRAPMLDALTGISGRATRSGNDALATEADALAVSLLAITDDAALNAATSYETMKAAGVAAYKRIANGVSPELSVVFREITGS